MAGRWTIQNEVHPNRVLPASDHRAREGAKRIRTMAGLVAAVLLLVWPAPVLAQSPPGSVVVECLPLSFQARNGGPIVLDWTMSWTGPGILEGTLEFEALDEDPSRTILLGRFRVPDLILADVAQTTRLMLPPLDVRGSLGQSILRGKFVTEKYTFTLPDQVVFVSGLDKRNFTIAVSQSGSGVASPGLHDLVEHGLSFERFDPLAREAPNRAVTVPSWIGLEDFPRDALLLCTFDVVALVDEGLTQLRREHLDAVHRWAAAGGAVFVQPGELIEARHVDFLNALAGLNGRPGGFQLDEQGRLAWPDGWDASAMKLHRLSLGRVVFAPQPTGPADIALQNMYDTAEWREAVWFLWRCRQELREPMRESGRWRGSDVPLEDGSLELRAAGFRPHVFGVQPLQSGGWLLDRLIPESVQLVPLWVVGCVLALFVVVVGPLDYFLLGMLRLRKLTWALFPVVALAFAWFTVGLSNSYMQTSEQSGTLLVLDVGDGGSIVRANELQLYFANTSRANVVDAQGELVCALDHRRFGAVFEPQASDGGLTLDPNSGLWTDGRGGYFADEQGNNRIGNFGSPAPRRGSLESTRAELVAPPVYDGRPPARYALSEWLPQWTPHLHRRFRIAPDGEFIAFDWPSVSAAELNTPSGRDRVYSRLKATFGQQISIAVLHRDQRQILVDDAELFRGGRSPADSMAAGSRAQPGSFLFELCARPAAGPQPNPFAAYQTAVFSSRQPGLFSLVSQISPTGGDNFEDLALLDPSDDQQWLLLVGVRRGNDWHLYRKLYVE